jgi:hypothetical protein
MARANPFKSFSQFIFRPLEKMIRRNVDRRLGELGLTSAGLPPTADTQALQLERELLRIESLRRKLRQPDVMPPAP